MFSPKVLDRANVIEFKISSSEMGIFLSQMKEVDRENINGKAAGMGTSFVELASTKELERDDEAVDTLQYFFNELKKLMQNLVIALQRRFSVLSARQENMMILTVNYQIMISLMLP